MSTTQLLPSLVGILALGLMTAVQFLKKSVKFMVSVFNMKSGCVKSDNSASILSHGINCVITARIRRMGKVIFSVCLSVHTWGGGYPIQLTGGDRVPCPADGGGGIPHPADGGGVPHPADGGGGYPLPRSGWGGGVPHPVDRGEPLPRQGSTPPRGTPPPPTRPAQRVLTTRRAVCLLRSRRRTFLLNSIFMS